MNVPRHLSDRPYGLNAAFGFQSMCPCAMGSAGARGRWGGGRCCGQRDFADNAQAFLARADFGANGAVVHLQDAAADGQAETAAGVAGASSAASRTKRSKIRARCSGGTPGPSSSTATHHASTVNSDSSVSSPPRGETRIALVTD